MTIVHFVLETDRMISPAHRAGPEDAILTST